MPVDPVNVIAEVLPALNTATMADLVFWTEAELYQFADEAVQRAAREAIVFAFIANQLVSPGATSLRLPTGSSTALWASWSGTSMREASVGELEALDDDWQNTTGMPKRWTVDLGTGTLRLYPFPSANGVLTMILQGCPPTVALGAATLPAVLPFGGYLLQAILGAARGKISDAIMPEIATHAEQRAALYLDVFKRYWGAGA